MPEPTLNNGGDDINDFLADVHAPAKFSADIPTDTDTAPDAPDFSGNSAAPLPDAGGSVQMSDADADMNTEILMSMRESAQAFGLAYYVEGSVNTWEKYTYPAEQKRNLVRAWSRIIQKANIRVSPWLDVVQAELFATAPLLALAHTSRQQRIKLERQAAEIARLQRENADFANKVSAKAGGQRSDSKTSWKIDENGYFQYTPAGAYIKQENRKEKPDASAENYQLLVKHNGKEFTDKALNIKHGTS